MFASTSTFASTLNCVNCDANVDTENGLDSFSACNTINTKLKLTQTLTLTQT